MWSSQHQTNGRLKCWLLVFRCWRAIGATWLLLPWRRVADGVLKLWSSWNLWHVLSCSFMFFHVLSCSFTFFHVLHVLSCSFMFFHVLSCSFMFFHFLSFSFIFFVFVGCSKSDFFLGLNFVTISLDSSFVKNQFLARLGRYPFRHSFPFFPTFFSVFFLSSLAFYFSFCSFHHFLIF